MFILSLFWITFDKLCHRCTKCKKVMVEDQDTKFEQSMVKLSVSKFDSRDYQVHGSDPLLNVPCPLVNGGREPGNDRGPRYLAIRTYHIDVQTYTDNLYQQIRTNPHTTQGYTLAWLIDS